MILTPIPTPVARDTLRASLIAHQAALDDALGDLAMTGVNAASTFAINPISLCQVLSAHVEL